MVRPLRAEPLRNPRPVHRMNPLKSFGDRACLICLNGTDVVPNDRQLLEQIHLGQRFLNVAFAEMDLPGAMSCGDLLDRLLLADCDDHHVVTIPAGALERSRDTTANIPQMVRDFSHALLKLLAIL